MDQTPPPLVLASAASASVSWRTEDGTEEVQSQKQCLSDQFFARPILGAALTFSYYIFSQLIFYKQRFNILNPSRPPSLQRMARNKLSPKNPTCYLRKISPKKRIQPMISLGVHKHRCRPRVDAILGTDVTTAAKIRQDQDRGGQG